MKVGSYYKSLMDFSNMESKFPAGTIFKVIGKRNFCYLKSQTNGKYLFVLGIKIEDKFEEVKEKKREKNKSK